MDQLPDQHGGPDEDRGSVLIIRILAVEDDAEIADLIRLLLVRNLPCRNAVAFAGTWAEAWAMLQRTRYNVVLLDLVLPDSPPEETVKRIPEILEVADAVCVVTGTGHRFREAAIGLGAFGHFDKRETLTEERGRGGFIGSIARAIQKYQQPTQARQNLDELKRVLEREQNHDP